MFSSGYLQHHEELSLHTTPYDVKLAHIKILRNTPTIKLQHPVELNGAALCNSKYFTKKNYLIKL